VMIDHRHGVYLSPSESRLGGVTRSAGPGFLSRRVAPRSVLLRLGDSGARSDRTKRGPPRGQSSWSSRAGRRVGREQEDACAFCVPSRLPGSAAHSAGETGRARSRTGRRPRSPDAVRDRELDLSRERSTAQVTVPRTAPPEQSPGKCRRQQQQRCKSRCRHRQRAGQDRRGRIHGQKPCPCPPVRHDLEEVCAGRF